MYNVGDLIKKDNTTQIIIKVINNGIALEAMPLKDYIQNNYTILHNDERLTITELTERLMNEYCNQKQIKE